MPKIIIGNGFSDAMVGDVSKNSIDVSRTAASEARRLIWFVENDDLIILPSPVSDGFIHYVNKVMHRQLTQDNFIYASDDPLYPQIISSEVLLSEKMLYRLRKINEDYSNWQFFPYLYTSAVQTLIYVLKREEFPLATFLTQSGGDLLNQKAAFRALYAKDVPLATGCICRNVHELYLQATLLFVKSNKLIFKQNLNASGDGNILVTTDKNSVYAGVREIVFLEASKNFTAEIANQIWSMLSDAQGNHQIVIEEYVSNQNTLYAEYDIKSDSKFDVLTYGIVRMEGSGDKRGNGLANWVGFEIPYQEKGTKSFLNYCDQLARTTGQLGFVGRINFDAIVCADDSILFAEINGRLGGCSHLIPVCQQILGTHFLHKNTLITRNRVSLPSNNLNQAILIANELSSACRDRGMVILNEDSACLKLIEYLVYAPTKSEALMIEAGFFQQLASNFKKCKDIL